MKIEIPKIWKTIELKEYAPEFGEVEMRVWVNPPRALLQTFYEIGQHFSVEKGKESLALLAQIWDQPVEDVNALMDSSSENDPLFFTWLIMRTFKLIEEHRNLLKKNWMVEFLKQPGGEGPAKN